MEDKKGLQKTCGNCGLLELHGGEGMRIPACKNLGIVVPHIQEYGEFIFTRIPINCPRKINVKPSAETAPKRDWVYKNESELTVK